MPCIATKRPATQRTKEESMRKVTATLVGRSPYSPSRYHGTPKLNKENALDYSHRTWREHCTYEKGTDKETGESINIIAIPAMAIKMGLDTAAGKLKDKAKGRKEWTSYFVSGVAPAEQCFSLGIDLSTIDFIDIWANSDGVRGSGKRVMRRYPVIPKWSAPISLDILDDSIPEDVIERYLTEAGNLVGIGRFRPEKGGFNGRFLVEDFSCAEVELIRRVSVEANGERKRIRVTL